MKTIFKYIAALGMIWGVGYTPRLEAQAQESDATESHARPRFQIGGFGIVNYFGFRWQTDPKRRNQLDLERFVVEPKFFLSRRVTIEADIEFEHGGTGSTVEFDPFEEFGEFETEIEKGGEVELEKLAVRIDLSSRFGLRLGRVYVPVGLVVENEEPDRYFTTTRNEAEASILPTVWNETGAVAFGTVGPLSWQAGVVSGLDATGFSSANWIRGGHQQRFETVNANNLAFVARVDAIVQPGIVAGFSGYIGNSTGNRPKADADFPAYVTIIDGHFTLVKGRFRVRGLGIYGHLQNAAAVSEANRNLSNNLGVKRTPVGSVALGGFLEAGYRIRNPGLDLFVRHDRYDTMHQTSGTIFDNPRWDRTVWTAGVNWTMDEILIFKGQFSRRQLGLATNNIEDTFSVGLAFIY